MINMQRTWAVVWRHLLLLREPTRIVWFFYWPFVDILLFGFSAVWAQSNSTSDSHIGFSMIAGAVAVEILHRSNLEGAINLLEELWSENMLNVFASPLRFSEWLFATFILSVITCTGTLLYSALIAWLFYSFNIFGYSLLICLFFIPIFLSGLWLGFISAAIVICYGARAQSIAFMLSFLAASFCGALYPVEILPQWAQMISAILPITPAFEGIRLLITTQTFSWYLLGLSTLLSSIYCASSIALFAYMFDKSKEKGFARLTAD